MTEQEWQLFVLELCGSFKGPRPIPAPNEAALRMHFGAVPALEARLTLQRLVQAGQVFDPVPGELVRQLRLVAGSDWRFECLMAGMSSEQLMEHKQREAERLIQAQGEHRERRRTAVESMREIRAELEAGHDG